MTVDAASLPGSLALIVGSSPRIPATNQTFGQDASVAVSGYKSLKDDALVVVLFVSNNSGAPLTSVAVDFTEPVAFASVRVAV